LLSGKDHISVLTDKDVKVYEFDDVKHELQVIHQSPSTKSVTNMMWSPRGTYLILFYDLGVKLFGGKRFQAIARFPHEKVKRVLFSNNEEILATQNESFQTCVWRVTTVSLLRTFDQTDFIGFSGDGQLFSRISNHVLYIHSLPSLALHWKYDASGIVRFKWGPLSTLFGFVSSCRELTRICVGCASSKTIVREKSFYTVQSMHLFWHESETYLACTSKEHLAVFCLCAKDVPVMMIATQVPTQLFMWAGRTNRFALIDAKQITSVFSIDERRKESNLIGTILFPGATNLYWSPNNADYLIVAKKAKHQTNFVVVVFEVPEWSKKCEQAFCSDLAWDGDGRFLLTSSTQPFVNYLSWDGRFLSTSSTQPFVNPPTQTTLDNGFQVWCCGKRLATCQEDVCYKVGWRPRPPSLLTKEQIEAIELRSVKHVDEKKQRIQQKRRLMRVEWQAYRKSVEQQHERDQASFVAMAMAEKAKDPIKKIRNQQIVQKKSFKQHKQKKESRERSFYSRSRMTRLTNNHASLTEEVCFLQGNQNRFLLQLSERLFHCL
jgi:uncharacterized protein with WD repeat